MGNGESKKSHENKAEVIKEPEIQIKMIAPTEETFMN